MTDMNLIMFVIIGTIIALVCLVVFMALFLYQYYSKRLNRQAKRLDTLSEFIEGMQAEHTTFAANVDKLSIQQKEQIKDLESLLAMIGHDLKSPVASIIGLAVLAKKNPADASVYADLMLKSAQNLETRLNELLQTVYNTNKQRKKEEIHFKSLIDEIIKTLEHVKGFEKTIFQIAVSDISPPFFSDKVLIMTIIQNLLENAIKYRSVEAEKNTIKISVSNFNEGVNIIVTDSGIGIEKEDQEKIFNLFYRATSQAVGTGLGLYNVKAAVERLEGWIELKSKTDIGSTFTVYLPY